MTTRTNGFDPLAEVVGVSDETVRTDLKVVSKDLETTSPTTVVGKDGKARPTTDTRPTGSPENRALLALNDMADSSGLVAGDTSTISAKVARLGGFEKKYQAEQAIKALVASGRVRHVKGEGLNVRTPDVAVGDARPVAEKKITEKRPKKLPRTGLDTRAPEDQNEHLWAAINSNRLSGSSQLVTMTANALLGAVSRGRKFGEVEREITADYMAAKTGLSTRTARTALADAVKAGFLVRLDQGKGGVAGRGKARYRAVLPVYGGTSDD